MYLHLLQRHELDKPRDDGARLRLAHVNLLHVQAVVFGGTGPGASSNGRLRGVHEGLNKEHAARTPLTAVEGHLARPAGRDIGVCCLHALQLPVNHQNPGYAQVAPVSIGVLLDLHNFAHADVHGAHVDCLGRSCSRGGSIGCRCRCGSLSGPAKGDRPGVPLLLKRKGINCHGVRSGPWLALVPLANSAVGRERAACSWLLRPDCAGSAPSSSSKLCGHSELRLGGCCVRARRTNPRAQSAVLGHHSG